MRRARFLLALAVFAFGLAADAYAQAAKPYRIYAITFRGMTDVERGFEDYFAARRIDASERRADRGTITTIITAYTISIRPAIADVLPRDTM